MTSASDTAVSVRGLAKAYTIAHQGERAVTLAESLLARARRPFARAATETFWALRDVSFDIAKGDVVGIIGRNGAGKSTLLKVLSRITEPTAGRVDLYGRVGSLLEVGTGFHPELTGRENVYLNGAILGMTKAEIRRQFDAIVDFAGVEQFLDTPVKRYSSGMYVRLAFAVAAHLETEILIVDEVLAVGDAEFQRKCMGKMKDVSSAGRTVVFVSHNMNAILSLCTKALLLIGGRLESAGSVDDVVAKYLSAIVSTPTFDLATHAGRDKGCKAIIKQLTILDAKDNPCFAVRPQEQLSIILDVASPSPIHQPRLSLGINNSRGERLFAVATFLSPTELGPTRGPASAKVTFSLPALVPGQYTLDVGLSDGPSTFLDAVYTAGAFDVVDDNYLGSSTPHFSEMGPVMVRSAWAYL